MKRLCSLTCLLISLLTAQSTNALQTSDFLPQTMTQSGALALGAGASCWANLWTDDWIAPTTASAALSWIALLIMENSLQEQGYQSTDYRTKVNLAIAGSALGAVCGKTIRYGAKKGKQTTVWLKNKLFGPRP